MTDLVMMKDVQEKLRRFRENPLSARPPIPNEINAIGFPGALNKPLKELSLFVYTLNDLIKKFENLNRYEEIDFLLDAFNFYKEDLTLLSKSLVYSRAIVCVNSMNLVIGCIFMVLKMQSGI